MNNREQLSKKSNPETKEKNQKSKREYQKVLQLNLFWLIYDKVWSISLAGLFFRRALYTGGTLLDGNKMVPEAKFCGIFFHRVLASGTFSVNAINNSTLNIFFLFFSLSVCFKLNSTTRMM